VILIDGKEWRPISFVDELVVAILGDMKTETRRIVQGVPYFDHAGRSIMEWALSGCYIDSDGRAWIDVQTEVDDNSHRELRFPYGKAGDRLWIRERFAAFKCNWREVAAGTGVGQSSLTESSINAADLVVFRDGSIKFRNSAYDPNDRRFGTIDVKRWRPPMHLPFWAHRIGLEVKSIRIERLQEITEGGACAEGFQNGPFENFGEVSALFKFRKKWDVINGARIDRSSGKAFTWGLNPFVWVVNFKRIV